MQKIKLNVIFSANNLYVLIFIIIMLKCNTLKNSQNQNGNKFI